MIPLMILEIPIYKRDIPSIFGKHGVDMAPKKNLFSLYHEFAFSFLFHIYINFTHIYERLATCRFISTLDIPLATACLVHMDLMKTMMHVLLFCVA